MFFDLYEKCKHLNGIHSILFIFKFLCHFHLLDGHEDEYTGISLPSYVIAEIFKW
jgi:hypothetical protein